MRAGAAIADAVCGFLDDPARLLATRENAYKRGRDMIWPAVAAQPCGTLTSKHVDALGIASVRRVCVFMQIVISALCRHADDFRCWHNGRLADADTASDIHHGAENLHLIP